MGGRRALILGLGGQDGWYLSRFLLNRGYELVGTVRPGGQADVPHIVEVRELDLEHPSELSQLGRDIRPQEIYYLAAYHSSTEGRESHDEPTRALAVNLQAPVVLLDLLRQELNEGRFFYASSCHVFGNPSLCPQDEETPEEPESLYAITKSAAARLCRFYRHHYGIHASVGILFNHESPRRTGTFVTTRIARAAALAARGRFEVTMVRDLRATLDWGSARDFVDAMWRILQEPSGDDYVIATGEMHSVEDFAREAFRYVGFDARAFIRQDHRYRPQERRPYVGNSAKLRARCGWHPTVSFTELVRELVEAQIATLR
jgi:GDPmannose 4,6-dehydratase